ncbi:MAG: helix-turn-helix transcriptional regulator [Clostridia bacterium]|nr:helix-turn-helix transcriptional regulator [Clostridia bacterium]
MVVLSKFVENLSSFMSEQNLNAPALAKIIKTDRSNITRYLQGKRLPSFQVFINIIEYFNVSADIILGLIDYTPETTFLPVSSFGKRFREVMEETKTTQYRIEHDLNISGSSVYKWLFNQSFPSVENLVKLSEYMEISVDYLLGRIR